MANLFERLNEGRPQQEPTPTPIFSLATPPAVLELVGWLQHSWDKPTIRARDIYRYGPHRPRGREKAIEVAEVLEKRGWLIPLKANRRDVRRQITIGD